MSLLSWLWDTYFSFFLFGIKDNCNTMYNGTLFVISGSSETEDLGTIYYTSLADLDAGLSQWTETYWGYDTDLKSSGDFGCWASFTVIDSLVYIPGPQRADGNMSIYNMRTKSRINASDYNYQMPYPTSQGCVVSDGGSNIYVFGGYDSYADYGSSHEFNFLQIYNIKNDTWTVGEPMEYSKRSASCSYDYINRKIYVIGGYSDGERLSIIERYDIDNNEWTMLTQQLIYGRSSHTSVFVNDYHGPFIYVIGGFAGWLSGERIVEVLNINTESISIDNETDFALYATGAAIETRKTNNNLTVLNLTKDYDGDEVYYVLQQEIKLIWVGGYIFSDTIKYGMIEFEEIVNINGTPIAFNSSIIKSLAMTTTTTTASGNASATETSEAPTNENDIVSVKYWETLGDIFMIVYWPLFVICMAAALFKITKMDTKGSDRPDIIPLAKVFNSVADFITDALFSIVLATHDNQQTDILFMCSVTFIVLPYLMSVIFGMYAIEIKWRRSTENVYLSEYVHTHGSKLIIGTIFIGFYPTIDIAQSKLFYWNMFGLQHKPNVIVFLTAMKFINIVLLEDIPQFILQVIYISTVKPEDWSFVVFFSMIFSIMSTISAMSLLLHKCCEKKVASGEADMVVVAGDDNGSVTKVKDTIEVIYTIKSDHLKRKHGFAHKTLQKCFYNVSKSRNFPITKQKGQYSLDFETWFIESHVHVSRAPGKFIKVTVYAIMVSNFEQNQNNILQESLTQIGIKDHALNEEMKDELIAALSLPKHSKVVITVNTTKIQHIKL